jgi:putative membrane protein
MQRSKKDYVVLAGKGMLMGAADAVPGVSGGTVAFITGIYEELIHSIRQCGPEALKTLFSQGLKAFWTQINGTFLLTLVSGILFSLVTLSRVVLYLLDQHPVLLWSFFFGLILASTWSVMRHTGRLSLNVLAVFLLGAVVALQITSMTPVVTDPSYFMIFISGMIAICAMILPGISGSFILLLLGMYAPVLMALKGFQLDFIGVFVLGCVTGLLSFSHFLSWAFAHYRVLTLSLLGGFMLGSLNMVWPWKYTLAYSINGQGEELPLQQKNILPDTFSALTGQDPLTLVAIGLMLAGMVLVLILDKR